jgi:hypothetical protein
LRRLQCSCLGLSKHLNAYMNRFPFEFRKRDNTFWIREEKNKGSPQTNLATLLPFLTRFITSSCRCLVLVGLMIVIDRRPATSSIFRKSSRKCGAIDESETSVSAARISSLACIVNKFTFPIELTQ